MKSSKVIAFMTAVLIAAGCSSSVLALDNNSNAQISSESILESISEQLNDSEDEVEEGIWEISNERINGITSRVYSFIMRDRLDTDVEINPETGEEQWLYGTQGTDLTIDLSDEAIIPDGEKIVSISAKLVSSAQSTCGVIDLIDNSEGNVVSKFQFGNEKEIAATQNITITSDEPIENASISLHTWWIGFNEGIALYDISITTDSGNTYLLKDIKDDYLISWGKSSVINNGQTLYYRIARQRNFYDVRPNEENGNPIYIYSDDVPGITIPAEEISPDLKDKKIVSIIANVYSVGSSDGTLGASAGGAVGGFCHYEGETEPEWMVNFWDCSRNNPNAFIEKKLEEPMYLDSFCFNAWWQEYGTMIYFTYITVITEDGTGYTMGCTPTETIEIRTLFSDPCLCTYVLDNIDTNNDGKLSYLECKNTTTLDISGLDVSDLTGIDVFPNLSTLKANNCRISSADLNSCPSLSNIELDGNGLKYLNISKLNYLNTISVCGNPELNDIDFGDLNYNFTIFSSVDLAAKLKRKSELTQQYNIGYNQFRSMKLDGNTEFDISFLDKLDFPFDKVFGASGAKVDVKRKCLTDITEPVIFIYLENLYEVRIDLTDVPEKMIALSSDNFPDEKLRTHFYYSNDWERNGFLSTPELSCMGWLGLDNLGLDDPTGIELLPYTTGIDLSDNNLYSLPDLKNRNVQYLGFNNNHISKVDVKGMYSLSAFYGGNNNLPCLDLTGTRVTAEDFYADNNSFSITLSGNTYSLEMLEEEYGFDPSRASNWNGAEYDAESNSLININGKAITYTYDCGNGLSAEFSLIPENLSDSAIVNSFMNDKTDDVIILTDDVFTSIKNVLAKDFGVTYSN